MTEKKKNSFLKTSIIKFFIYLAIGFVAALIYRELKK